MKRWFLLTAVIMMLWLVACGAPSNPIDPAATADPETAKQAITTETEVEGEAGAVEVEENETESATTNEPAAVVNTTGAQSNLTPLASPAADIPTAAQVRTGDWIKGAEDPILTVVEYADFQCPACSAVSPMLKQLVEAYPDEVQVIYRHFPLVNIHDKAHVAAQAAEAAGAQGQFWPFHDAIFANFNEFSALDPSEATEFFVRLAQDTGLDGEQLRADLENGTYEPYVESVYQEAVGLGLPGTPSLIVNGELIQGGTPPYEAWVEYLTLLRETASLEEMQYDAPPAMTIDESKQYFATVTLESGDSFVIELYPQSAPLTVNSFVFLAAEGWFDGVTFHRVLPGFVAQTGDPTGTGMGGPGYAIPNEVDPALTHADTGIVAMANSGPDTNGSQWYITLGDASFLDGGYTIFGHVIEGMETVQSITPRDPSTNPNAPAGDKIVSIVVEER